MIKQLRIKNFKSLADTGDLELKPLTILVGPNSSGKSALFKALLALKQTAESRDLQSPLIVNGDYVKLGSYRDFIYGHDLGRSFSIELSLSGARSSILRKILETFDEMSKAETTPDNESFKVEFGCNQKTQQIRVNAVEITHTSEFSFKVIRGRIGNYKIYPRVMHGNVALNKFYMVTPELRESNSRHRIGASIFFFAFSQFIEDSLKNVHSLGPLRAAPARFYVTSGETPQDVGLAGERAVDVLWMQRQQARTSKDPKGLVLDVEEWVKKFGFSLEVRFSKASPTMYEVFFIDPYTQFPVNLADVGFGASQVLPVIVEGFYCSEGSTLLIEQPEIHLHPKAQATLGDLFVDISKHNKQVIVETHSEHLINRVQLRIADETIAPSDVTIYYFEPTEEGTHIRPIELTEYGQYVTETLPAGFFDENYAETYDLVKVILERKKKEEKSAKVR